jgi:iron complex outermembrane receptor protein
MPATYSVRALPAAIALIIAYPVAPQAAADHMEELVVSASHDRRTIDVTDALSPSPDVTQLLKKAPGANVNTNGPITAIPQYRGMSGARVAVSLDGAQLAPSGPNWMDPPLSYATGGQLEALEVYRGIAPVSVAQEAIGGAIIARQTHSDFSLSGDFELSGRAIASTQSVNDGYQLNGALHGANDSHRVKIAGLTERGDDAEFPGGDILPTEYERERYDLGYGFRTGPHTLQLEYGYNDTGDAGTPALPMDIQAIEGDLYNLRYNYDAGATSIAAGVYASDLDHTMTNYHLRQPPEASRWRRNTASSDNVGMDISATLRDDSGSWTLGADVFDSAHDSDIDNPNNPMFFVVNFNNAERQVYGAFVERQQTFSDHWRGEFGLRYNRVEMDADEVNGTPAMMMPPAQALRDAFNNADREQTDDNIDLAARVWYKSSESSNWYVGLARKTRSPSYQERYLWLPLEATAGLADGNTYTGNIDLDPETANTVEFGLDFSGAGITVSPRLFYSYVQDYIQGTPSEITPALMFVRMMNDMNGTNAPDPLQFNNVDAELYGFDMDWAWAIDEHWSLTGIVNYVRGRRDDTSDDLYRIAPANASLRLGYTGQDWTVGVEGIAYAEQDDVSKSNREQQTSGYGVMNVEATWQVTPALQLAAGVDNIFDREYEEHLGGYNRAANPDIGLRERLPAYGANAFARLVYTF